MEEQNKDSDIVRQMATYNFNEPVKVTLIFDEEETNELNKSLENINNCFENPTTQTFQTNNLELLSRCIDDQFPANACLEIVDNTYDIESETNYETGTLTSKVMNVQNNNVATNREINHRRPIWTSQINTSLPNNNHQHSTSMGLETRKTNSILYLLDKLSFDLIEISKYYYNNVSREIYDQAKYQRAKSYYRYFKHKHFDNSYSILKSFIISLENHPTFMENFLNRTIALALSKSLYNISSDYLIKIIGELLDYTKHRMQLESKSNDQTRKPSTDTCRKNGPSRTTSKNVINSNKDNDFIHILSCGPKDREIRISVEPNVLNCTQNHVTKRQKTGSSCDSEAQSTRNKDNNYHVICSRTQILTHLPNESTSLAPQQTMTHNNLPYIEREVIILDNDDVNHDNRLATSRSSVSRDSGFNSPISTIQYPGDQLVNSSNNFDIFITPSTSHTTSMNREGLIQPTCKICGLVTNKMCLGCHRVHYCSLQCQKKDWTLHKSVCRK